MKFETRQKIGKALRAAREATGENSRIVGEKIGKSHTTVCDWEKGIKEPSVAEYIQLANAVGIKIRRGDHKALAKFAGVEPEELLE